MDADRTERLRALLEENSEADSSEAADVVSRHTGVSAAHIVEVTELSRPGRRNNITALDVAVRDSFIAFRRSNNIYSTSEWRYTHASAQAIVYSFEGSALWSSINFGALLKRVREYQLVNGTTLSSGELESAVSDVPAFIIENNSSPQMVSERVHDKLRTLRRRPVLLHIPEYTQVWIAQGVLDERVGEPVDFAFRDMKDLRTSTGYVDAAIEHGEELRSVGWNVITATINDVEVPVYAIPPSGHHNAGWHGIMLLKINISTLYSAVDVCGTLLGMLLSDLDAQRASREHEGTSEEEQQQLDAAVQLYHDYMDALRVVREHGRLLSSMRTNVRRHADRIQELTSEIASARRAITDGSCQMAALEGTAIQCAIDTMNTYQTLPPLISAMRPVRSVEVLTRSNKRIIEVTIHPFGMYLDDMDVTVEIPPHIIALDPMAVDFDTAIDIRGTDQRPYHPHVSEAGSICWGRAATSLAEAWGRRDWQSLFSIVFAWWTQYNGEDPYQHGDELCDHLQHIDTRGWIVPTTTEVPA